MAFAWKINLCTWFVLAWVTERVIFTQGQLHLMCLFSVRFALFVIVIKKLLFSQNIRRTLIVSKYLLTLLSRRRLFACFNPAVRVDGFLVSNYLKFTCEKTACSRMRIYHKVIIPLPSLCKCILAKSWRWNAGTEECGVRAWSGRSRRVGRA